MEQEKPFIPTAKELKKIEELKLSPEEMIQRMKEASVLVDEALSDRASGKQAECEEKTRKAQTILMGEKIEE